MLFCRQALPGEKKLFATHLLHFQIQFIKPFLFDLYLNQILILSNIIDQFPFSPFFYGPRFCTVNLMTRVMMALSQTRVQC